MEKDFFIGKKALQKKLETTDMKVVRVQLAGEKGVRPVRQNDCVLKQGECAGWILSSTTIGERQIALAYVSKDKVNEGDEIGLYYAARNERQVQKGRKAKAEKGERLQADVNGKVLSRFERF